MTTDNGKTKVAINGFGRIGRQVLRVIKQTHADTLEVVAINSRGNRDQITHLLKYDSTYGRYEGDIVATEAGISVDGADVRVFSESDPSSIPWDEVGAEIVVESTGVFTDASQASKHLDNGPQKVIISAPATNDDITIVLGINDDQYDPAKHQVISNASCTTNCVAPMAKVLNDSFGIERALMSTIHSYTNDQQILDKAHKDLRRARAAANSIIPTTTGAARSVAKVIPELKGKMDGMAYRVPTISGSVTDLTAWLSEATDVHTLNQAFRDASVNGLRGIMAVSDEPLVSVDYIGDPYSCTIDALSTTVVEDGDDGTGTFVKVVGWYDNEWGYSSRTADLAALVASRM